MFKKLAIIFSVVCMLCAAPMAVNAAEMSYSVTPVVGAYKSLSADSDYTMTYGAQLEARKGQFAVGAELLGFSSNTTDGRFSQLSGFNPNVFARLYILDPDNYWITPFIGAGVGFAHSDDDMANGARNAFVWNVDAGLRAELADYDWGKLDAIVAARYQQYDAFQKEDGVQNLGGYVGLGLSF